MIKQVHIAELRIGMYIHDLQCSWMKHPFARNQFTITDESSIQKMASIGLKTVAIDTDKGRDVDDESVMLDEVNEPEAIELSQAMTSLANERVKAKALFRESTSVVRNLMEASRSGRQVDVAAIDPLAEKMVQSVLRNPHAMTSVARIKTKDEYTFMHCVSVAALLAAFAKEMGMSQQEIQEITIGGLVHDLGKTLVDQAVLNKPSKLDDTEFAHMREHVSYSMDLLKEAHGLSQIALDVAFLHHERMDGKGYPRGLKGEEISLIGRMSAIVDVYDALTSARVYKEPWAPTLVMKKIMEWSPQQFDRELVHRFARCIGIYPVGALVALKSGLVGIVMEPGEDLLRPKLRIVYNRKHEHYVEVRDLDLATAQGEQIVEALDPAMMGIKVDQFL